MTALFEKIPWTSFGRKTPISQLARSIVPIGNHDRVLSNAPGLTISNEDPGFEDWIMDIEGTAFQCGFAKFLTCWHVCTALRVKQNQAYIQASSIYRGVPAKTYYPVQATLNFIDPRTRRGTTEIDIGLVVCAASSLPDHHYDVPDIKWGDSTKVGLGDRVLIGGFPLGRDLFTTVSSNRGIVQPTFYDGVISAILPATKIGETRLFQISSVALGGISGGVVCLESGRVIGMITSGLTQGEVSLPISYAIPSEVLQPWVDAITFDTIQNSAAGR